MKHDILFRAFTVSGMALVLTLGACAAGKKQETAQEPVVTHIVTETPVLAIAQPQGVKTVYFNEDLQDASARLNGMQNTLDGLQGDLVNTASAMQRVDAMRQEIAAMHARIAEMQARSGGPAIVQQTTTIAPAPLMSPEPSEPVMLVETTQVSKPVVEAKPAKAPAQIITGENGVQGVRIGVHPDNVRVVLDVVGKTAGYSANVDASEKLLTVDLPNTKWAGQMNATVKNNPLISSWTAQDSGQGSVVVFTLKSDAKISSQSVIKGSAGKPARIVIDLAK